MAFPPRHK